jgi:tetraacyldisaccharide 4'-kinase
MKAPAFWDDPNSVLARGLAPLGWVYATATAARLSRAQPWRAPIPVICVGNLTAGGAGKTPVVRDLAWRLRERRPAILSRGYGGRLRGPLKVDPMLHRVEDVGDEPLMLAPIAPCWIGADRAEAARAIAASDAGLIIMDDGLQNPDLRQDLRLIVVDGATGFGNRRAIPAGPLREDIDAGIARADGLVVMGEDIHDLDREFSARLPVIHAEVHLLEDHLLAGRRVFAFAGIGRPEKFRRTLEQAGAEVVAFHSFPDHHAYTDTELSRLVTEAAEAGTSPITTEKDWMRVAHSRWSDHIRPTPAQLIWKDEGAIMRLLERVPGLG